MGWTIQIQIVRDRPLSGDERQRLAAHVRGSKLQRQGYGFAVAPADQPGGVVAVGGGKLARSPDPDQDPGAARLYRALTELRALIDGATLEVADDLHLVGWDGAAYQLVDNPDQELTPAPGDRSSWLAVPPVRARKPAAPRPPPRGALPAPVEEALAVLAAGGEPQLPGYDDQQARALVPALFAALTRAGKARDHRRTGDLHRILARLPGDPVVDHALEPRLATGAGGRAVAEAMARVADPGRYRDRLLAIWFGRQPGQGADDFWSRMWPTLEAAAARDAELVRRLGESLIDADLDAWRELGRRNYLTIRVLGAAPGGTPWLVHKRRRERSEKIKHGTGPLLDAIAAGRQPAVVPTLLLELARPGTDRDGLLRGLAGIDDPRVLPILERALATDQYTRVIAGALIGVAGAPVDAILERLDRHVDPLVRIRAAQGLVARRGEAELPRLLAAVAAAAAAGAWQREHGVGTWSSEQLGEPERALRECPHQAIRTATWPEQLAALEVPAAAGPVEPMAAWSRTRSLNPDVRRDAIESAHAAALAARDRSRVLALVLAERWHDAVLRRADVPLYTMQTSCSRVHVAGRWSSWIKLARLPFDPMYKYTSVTWDHLTRHIGEVAAQVVPPELADLTSEAGFAAALAAVPDQRLRFTAGEVADWDRQEQALAAPVGAARAAG